MTTATIVTVALVLAAGTWLFLRHDDDLGHRPAAEAPAPVRLRWTNDTHRGPQPDLVVVVGDGFAARFEGPLHRYRVEDHRIRCLDVDDSLDCAPDPVDGLLMPSAGTTDLAALDGETHVFAGREAHCWSFAASTGEIRNCADAATGIPVLTETRSDTAATWSRQELVEWSPATVADLTLPPEVAAVVG